LISYRRCRKCKEKREYDNDGDHVRHHKLPRRRYFKLLRQLWIGVTG
jgi:hypothetical protein